MTYRSSRERRTLVQLGTTVYSLVVKRRPQYNSNIGDWCQKVAFEQSRDVDVRSFGFAICSNSEAMECAGTDPTPPHLHAARDIRIARSHDANKIIA